MRLEKILLPAISVALLFSSSSCKKEGEATIHYYFALENPGPYSSAVINLDFLRIILSEAEGNDLLSVDIPPQRLEFDLANPGAPKPLGSATIRESTVLGFDFSFDDAVLSENGNSVSLKDPMQSNPRVKEAFNVSDGQSRKVTFVLDLAASDSVDAGGNHFFEPSIRLEVN